MAREAADVDPKEPNRTALEAASRRERGSPGTTMTRVRAVVVQQQASRAGAANPPPIGGQRLVDRGSALRPAASGTWTRHVASDPHVGEGDQRRRAVEAPFTDEFGQTSGGYQHSFEVVTDQDQPFDRCPRVTENRLPNSAANAQARVTVEGVLGLLGNVGPAVLHRRDLCIRFLGTPPIFGEPRFGPRGKSWTTRCMSVFGRRPPAQARAETSRGRPPGPGGGAVCSTAFSAVESVLGHLAVAEFDSMARTRHRRMVRPGFAPRDGQNLPHVRPGCDPPPQSSVRRPIPRGTGPAADTMGGPAPDWAGRPRHRGASCPTHLPSQRGGSSQGRDSVIHGSGDLHAAESPSRPSAHQPFPRAASAIWHCHAHKCRARCRLSIWSAGLTGRHRGNGLKEAGLWPEQGKDTA